MLSAALPSLPSNTSVFDVLTHRFSKRVVGAGDEAVDAAVHLMRTGSRSVLFGMLAVIALVGVILGTARISLEGQLKELTDPRLTHAQIRAFPDGDLLTGPGACAAAQNIRDELVQLRARCQRYAASIVTPMGDEMFYRYQESLIDEATTTLALLLQRSASTPAA